MARPIFIPQINQVEGTEPHLVLAINYSLVIQWFATKDLTIGNIVCEGSIKSTGRIVSEIKTNNAATISTVQIEIADTAGYIKAGLDATVFEKTKATLYLHYVGNSAGGLIPLMSGDICGPVKWNETDRTVSFSIESHVQDQDFGYAPTVQDMPDLDPEAQGIAWPMIFGNVAHVPCVKIKSRPIGNLIFPIQLYKNPPYTANQSNGSWQFTLADSPDVLCANNASTYTKNIIYVDGLPNFNSSTSSIVIDNVIFQGSIDSNDRTKFNVTKANPAKYLTFKFGDRVSDTIDPSKDSRNYNVCWMPDDLKNVANCHLYIRDLDTGVQLYNVCVKQVGRKCWLRSPFMTKLQNVKKPVLITSKYQVDAVYPINKTGLIYDIESYITEMQDGFAQRARTSGGAGSPFGQFAALLDNMQLNAASWWTADSDAEVRPVDTTVKDTYVCSLINLSSITAIYGKRKIKDAAGKTHTIFAPIPDNYYTKTLSSSYGTNGQKATTVVFDPPLRDYKDQNWEDTIYVTGKSSVGPNPVDIISFIVKNFTTLSVDQPSFDACRPLVRDTNFAIFEKREALQIIEEIAYQSRLGVVMENGSVSLRFLAKVPFVSAFLTDVNIDVDGGYYQSQTSLNEIKTKIVATWNDTYKERRETTVRHNDTVKTIENIVRALVPDSRRSNSETKYYIYLNNTKAFGTRVETTIVYVFNEASPVKECIDFWGFRKSNVWRKGRFKTFPSALPLQPFDTVNCSMNDQSLLYAGALTGMVTRTEFDYTDMSVIVDVTFPVQVGTQEDLSRKFWPGNTYDNAVNSYGQLVWSANSSS